VSPGFADAGVNEVMMGAWANNRSKDKHKVINKKIILLKAFIIDF
jgi:hypothetical protein